MTFLTIQKRRKSDITTNNKKIKVLRQNALDWKTARWKNLEVGDIVKVESNHSFPSDLLFLSSR
jgi:phospholipid-transporting ATPase